MRPCDVSYDPFDGKERSFGKCAAIAAAAVVAVASMLLVHVFAMSEIDAALKENIKVAEDCGLPMREVVVDSDVEVHLVDPDEHGRAPALLAVHWAAVVTEDGVMTLTYAADGDDLRLVDSEEWSLVKRSAGGDYLLARDTAGWWPFKREVFRKVKGSLPKRLPDVHWELRVPFDRYGKEPGSAGRLADGDRGVKLVTE